MINVGVSPSFAGAEIITFFAPPSKWAFAFSVVQYAPVASIIYSAPHAPHGINAASDSENTGIFCPSMISPFSYVSSSPENVQM